MLLCRGGNQVDGLAQVNILSTFANSVVCNEKTVVLSFCWIALHFSTLFVKPDFWGSSGVNINPCMGHFGVGKWMRRPHLAKNTQNLIPLFTFSHNANNFDIAS